jgi:hypothetical protein
MIIKSMHEMGIRREHAYLAGMASIGLSIASWITSLPGALEGPVPEGGKSGLVSVRLTS